MNLIEYLSVKIYFYNKLKKVRTGEVWVSFPSEMSYYLGIGKFIPFHIGKVKKSVKYKKWIKQSMGVCYEHSANVLLGLNENDKKVTAICDYNKNLNFYHAWNEFEFNGKWYVFDNKDAKIYEKDKYYQIAKPTTIIETYSLKDILDYYSIYKTSDQNFDYITIPSDLPIDKKENLEYCYQVGTKNQCYNGVKITLNKDGTIRGATVRGPEIG